MAQLRLVHNQVMDWITSEKGDKRMYRVNMIDDTGFLFAYLTFRFEDEAKTYMRKFKPDRTKLVVDGL